MTNDIDTGRDRRQFPRVTCTTPVIVIAAGQIKSLESRDVGPGGLFVYARCSPPIGTDVRVEFDVARELHFQLDAKVVRTQPPSGILGPGGFAVAFNVTRDVRETIARALHLADGPG